MNRFTLPLAESEPSELSALMEFMMLYVDIDSTLSDHISSSDGDCVDCSGARSVQWPCPLAYAAQQIQLRWHRFTSPNGTRPSR